MPVIGGKVHRSRFTSLKLRELSSVDNPAQPGARMAIMKRNDAAPELRKLDADVAKYVCETDGAHTFNEVLAENKFSQNVWPCVDALSQSIRSIVGDGSLTGGEREAQVSASVQQFLTAVREISPEVSKQLEPLLVRKKEDPMPKTVEELQADLNKANADLATANQRAETEKARADAAVTALETEKSAHGETKKSLVAATDAVLKVGDVEVRKSEVGEAQFNLTKGLQDEARTARLEKRAADEYSHVVGTPTEKALVLKTIEDLAADNPTRKALEAIMQSAEKMVAAGFSRLGGNGGASPTLKAAAETFDAKVNEIAKRDNISKTKAMSKARSEFPAEFAAAHADSQ